MSESNRQGDAIYAASGEPMVTACRMGNGGRPMPPCAYCTAESTRTCDAEGSGGWGRCAVRMCQAHTTRVGKHHDLCCEHAGGDQLETLRRGDTGQRVFWERVETTAVPIPGTERPLLEDERIAGAIDPDDELA